MRIAENTTERLVLKGTPGSIVWMVFATLLGLAAMGACGWFGWLIVTETGGYLPLIPLGFGFLMGLAFFLLGVLTIVVGRMRLEFDRVTGNGEYDVYSPVIEVGKPCTFRLSDVDSVLVDRREEERPRTEVGGSFPAKVCRAHLRLRKPRRTIVLDETENGQEQRVQGVADAVAEWLEMEVAKH